MDEDNRQRSETQIPRREKVAWSFTCAAAAYNADPPAKAHGTNGAVGRHTHVLTNPYCASRPQSENRIL